MTSNRVAYAITQGYYSDYSVLFVVDGNREEAEALAERMNASRQSYDEYEVQEFSVVSPDLQQETLTSISLDFRKGANTEASHQFTDWNYGHYWPELEVRWCGSELRVTGTDEDRAWRVFWDRKAQILAHLAETGELPPEEA